jgi:hypothetical protein
MEKIREENDKEKALGRLKELTSHKHVKLTNCCNSAILLAFIMVKQKGCGTILIPDQGGWLTYKTFPQLLGLKIVEIKTDYGILDLKDLAAKADSSSSLIIASLAGYIAPQPLKEISKICREKGCLLIEDASGAIGMAIGAANGPGGSKTLCDGKLSDIIVASFGKWKPVNLRYGGFISTNSKELFEIDPELWQTFKFHDDFLGRLLEKLDAASQHVSRLQKACEKIKADLKDMKIIHKDQPGLNVIVLFSSPAEKEKIINYCKTNGYEHTVCPRYIRVMDQAVSIEVKRLD